MRYLLHDVFTASVQKNPNKVAIIPEFGDSVSYSQLNKIANIFAHDFAKTKISILESPYVGILGPVDVLSIASVLGILKIGGAYVPLDEYSPTERLTHIIANTKLDIIIIHSYRYEKHSELFDRSEIKKVIIIGDKIQNISIHAKATYFGDLTTETQEPPLINQVSDDLAYVLHSSGSTGIPKGIMLTHRNARTFVDRMQKEFKLTTDDKIMSRAPFKFDLSVFDIFNSFAAGASIICYDRIKVRDESHKHSDYVSLMKKEKASILYTTPSTLISLLHRGGLDGGCKDLRTIMYAGEPFPTPQLRKLQNTLTHTKIANIYGPTETNIITYYWIEKIKSDEQTIPLGDVVDDTEILVVSDEGDRICKSDEIGELRCRGGTVTIGYLGLESKTKECLVKSPFHQYPVRFWRTGDYGYRDEKGCLYYRGRKDHMIKVKGFRIEIGEVENAISSFPGIDEFVVVAKPDEKYGNRLYCYYSILKGQDFGSKNIKEHLLKKIPEYMIPFDFYVMQTLPKTSSGKIDRVHLSQL